MNEELVCQLDPDLIAHQEEFFIIAESIDVLIMTIFLATISAIGCVGNTLVIIVCIKYPTKRNLNFFILFVAVIDLFVCIVIAPFRITSYHILFQESWCKFFECICYFSIIFSIFLLICIAFERYFTICHHTRHILTTKRSKMLVFITFVLSLVISLSAGIVAGAYIHVEVNDTIISCFTGICNEDGNDIRIFGEKGVALYSYLLGFLYLSLLLTIVVLYSQVFVTICRHQRRISAVIPSVRNTKFTVSTVSTCALENPSKYDQTEGRSCIEADISCMDGKNYEQRNDNISGKMSINEKSGSDINQLDCPENNRKIKETFEKEEAKDNEKNNHSLQLCFERNMSSKNGTDSRENNLHKGDTSSNSGRISDTHVPDYQTGTRRSERNKYQVNIIGMQTVQGHPKAVQFHQSENHNKEGKITPEDSKSVTEQQMRKSIIASNRHASHKKVARILLLVTLAFLLTWIPFLLMRLNIVPNIITIRLSFFLSNMCNPLIYSFTNQLFRQNVQRLRRDLL